MKNMPVALILVIIITSLASAEIIINTQPKETYNLGETISIPVTVKSLIAVSSVFDMNLICQGHEINFYKNGVGLSSGEEKRMDPSLILTKNLIKDLKGDCTIKAILGTEYVLTNDFKISDEINIHVEVIDLEILPGSFVNIEGGATKESGNEVNGFIEIQVYLEGEIGKDSEYINHLETINNGFFSANVPTPHDIAAGEYTIILKAYEKDPSEEITNQGTGATSFLVKQIPTNLEILMENPEVEPGTSLKLKVILHDQTGQNIPSNSKITIKNNKDRILEVTEISTDENFEFPIAYNEAPGEFKIFTKSDTVEAQSSFSVKEKKDIKIQITNKTLTVTNTGNIPYCNDPILVKIGEKVLNLDVCLGVDKEQQYTLSAPDGEYDIEIITEEENVKQSIALTGKTIDIKEASKGVVTLTRYPLIWIFVIAILGFVATTIMRKGYKRSFIGRIYKKKQTNIPPQTTIKQTIKSKPLFSSNKAEFSLSIKGEKQNTSLVCLKIKNLKEIQSDPKATQEIINKIGQIAKDKKAVIYENEENIFFMLVPIQTKTFKNEKTALLIAQEIKILLAHHNKLFKQKINFGLSINYGVIIAKTDKDKFEFMSFGDLITTARKIASVSKGEILLSEKIKEKFGSGIKTQKQTKDNVVAYSIIQIKDRKDSEKFIKNFLDRLEKK
ncbi:MAG: hypothetical protein ABIH59_02740 [archaeon]